MKYAALMMSFLSLPLHANPELIRQLMTPLSSEEISEEYVMESRRSSSTSLNISFEDCQKAQELRQVSPINIQALNYYANLCSIRTYTSEGKVVGFQFENETQNAINPRTALHGSTREFNFNFPQRHVHDAHISITENSGLTSQMSHDFLETTLVFIPRKVVPSIEVFTFNGIQYRRISLPTGETIDVKATTSEIISGALKETPMDMTASRHDRKFVGLEYQGKGIMIRVDRRAGTPEHIYTQSFNRHEKIKDATLVYRGKTCLVPKQDIWVNAHNADLSTYFKFASDQEFLEKVVNPKCGWNLSLNDLE